MPLQGASALGWRVKAPISHQGGLKPLGRYGGTLATREAPRGFLGASWCLGLSDCLQRLVAEDQPVHEPVADLTSGVPCPVGLGP